MTALVDIHEARAHLRVDSYADDLWLELMIQAVSAAVLAWLKDSWRAYEPALDSAGQPMVDSNGDQIPAIDGTGAMTPKAVVKAAVLVELAQQYRFRDGSGAAAAPQHWGHGYVLGMGATSLLNALRKPTFV